MTQSIPPSAPRKVKRKRGSQPGNRNAYKHGFYSTSLDDGELCRFWNMVNLNGIPPEIATMNLKLLSLLRNAPRNRRVLKEAVKSLTKWYSVKYCLNKENTRYMKTVITGILEKGAAELNDGQKND